MPILNINNTQFYYELHGNGTPLVLISGLKADHNGWLPILEALSKKYQVLIFDNRGIGQTVDSGSAFSVETMAEDAMAIINSLGLKMPHIVGHSLGGAIAQQIARKYSVNISSVTLSNTFLKFNAFGRTVFSNVLKLYQQNASPADIMEYIVPEVFSKKFLNPSLMEIIRKASNDNPYPQSLEDYSRQLNALYEFDSRQWIQEINVPTLIIGSEEDKVATLIEAKEIAESISNSKLVVTATGHGSKVEQPEIFTKYLTEFYNSLDGLKNNEHTFGRNAVLRR